MWTKGRWIVGLLLFALAYPAGRMYGQAIFGSIVGTVTDSTGAVVPRAKVTITEINKNVSFSTTSNESGNYEQTHLIVGVYRLRVEAAGFQAYVQENLGVNVDSVTRVDARLEVGAITQTVNVTAEVPLLKTERTDVATTFSTKAVEELPIFNRNFTQFELLSPGTQRLGWQHAASENPQGSIQIMVNGQHFGGTSFQLDGTDNRDPILGIIVINPSLDSVTETKITTQNYDAEFGQATAGVVSAQTKSGTNELHGTAFLFRRNDLTQARNPFTQSVPIEGTNNRFVPQSLWDQFGGSLGGPIRKNKTFVFGDYQGTRRKMGGSVLTRVPTEAERGGDLSDLGVNIYDPCSATVGGTDIASTDCNVPPGSRQQFMGDDGKSPNVIPTARLSDQAQALLKYIPPPNIPGAKPTEPNNSSSGNQIFNDDAFDVRADHYWSERLHLFGRYSFARFMRSGPGAYGLIAGGPSFEVDPTVGGFSGHSDVRNQSIAGGFDYTLRPTWMTDFRFGFFRYRVFVNPNGVGTAPATDAKIPGLNLDSTFTSGMPAFFIDGIGGYNFGYSLGNNQCNCPLDEEEQQFQFVNNWTNIRGNHTLKFGADIRFAQNLRVPSDNHRAGELYFESPRTESATGGGLGLAAFLLGDVSGFARYVSKVTDAAERQKRWYFYGQDTWRITPRFTLSYGLRWEVYFPQTVNGTDKGGWVDMSTGETMIAGRQGVGLNGNAETPFTNFAPRVGIAYQVTPKTVVRLGYGRSFDVGVFGVTFGHTVTQNLPVLGVQNLQPADAWRSVFGLAEGPPAFDPAVVLENNCNPITDPTGTKTECFGPNNRPLYPDGVTPRVLPRRNKMPTVDAWNATIQHQLTPSLSIEASYVGNKGTRIYVGDSENYDINQATIVGFGTLSLAERKPFYHNYGWSQTILWYGKDANDSYESLQAKVEKRFSHGYSIAAHYTLARSYDYDSNYWPVDHHVAYGPSDFQRNHVFVLSHIWELPFGRGKKYFSDAPRALDLLVGGWQISGVTAWESGLPFTPSYQDCGADIDTGPCRPNLAAFGAAWVSNPNEHGWYLTTGGQELATTLQKIGPWQRPLPGTFGNVRRDSMRGPGLFNGDMSFFKNFQITERVKGQFRAESFNFWNRANLDNPDGCVDCATGGQIFGLVAGTAMRQWQFALRFQF